MNTLSQLRSNFKYLKANHPKLLVVVCAMDCALLSAAIWGVWCMAH